MKFGKSTLKNLLDLLSGINLITGKSLEGFIKLEKTLCTYSDNSFQVSMSLGKVQRSELGSSLSVFVV